MLRATVLARQRNEYLLLAIRFRSHRRRISSVVNSQTDIYRHGILIRAAWPWTCWLSAFIVPLNHDKHNRCEALEKILQTRDCDFVSEHGQG
jgi:hypothetical protein